MKYVVFPSIVNAVYCFCTRYGEMLERGIDRAIRTGRNCSQVCNDLTYGQGTEASCSSAIVSGCRVCTFCSRCEQLD